MKKKVFIVISIIVILLAIIIGTMYLIDLNKMKKGEEVIFSTWGAKYAPIKKENTANEETDYEKVVNLKASNAVDTSILVKFDGVLYGKSYSLIDYAGGSKAIGTIDKLIDSKYVPKLDGQTNTKEILGATVYDKTENTIVLLYNNTYELFEKIKTINLSDEEIKQKGIKVFGNDDYCTTDHSLEVGGDAITSWNCKICGTKADNPTTNVPKLCNYCAKITERCNQCGKLKDEHSFFGKVIELNEKRIIVEPNENEEIRNAGDKVYIGLGEYNDALYEVGTNVKITYKGTVMTTYPLQVKATKIELKSVDKFGLVFYQKTMIQPKQKEKIISKGEIKGIDYNVYAYEGHVAINLNSDNQELSENSISLRNALLQGKITIDEIIARTNQDETDGKIKSKIYEDGGSIEYHYDNYTIIKCHTLDGNRDVYIGTKEMKLKDVI